MGGNKGKVMTVEKVTCHFVLPYIVLPEGFFHFKYGDEVFDIGIKYHIVPALLQIITGIKYDPKNPVSINGPQEIFKGISEQFARCA